MKYEYEYLYEYYPSVVICPGLGKLLIEGESLDVQKISPPTSISNGREAKESETVERPDLIETSINGEFDGWEGDTIVRVFNGQTWQQTEYCYHYHYAYGPRVRIFRTSEGYKMQVEGVEEGCRRNSDQLKVVFGTAARPPGRPGASAYGKASRQVSIGGRAVTEVS